VRLDPEEETVDIIDVIDSGRHEVKLAYHFGPQVRVSLDGTAAELSWPDAATPGAARLTLPAGLDWRAYRGSTAPIMGWYSTGLGHKTPAVALVGTGRCRPEDPLITKIEFIDVMLSNSAELVTIPGESGDLVVQVSLGRSVANLGEEPEMSPEACQ